MDRFCRKMNSAYKERYDDVVISPMKIYKNGICFIFEPRRAIKIGNSWGRGRFTKDRSVKQEAVLEMEIFQKENVLS